MKSFAAEAKATAEGVRTAFLAIGAGAAIAVGESLRLASQFDESMRKVYALAGLSADEFESMKKQVLDLSTIVPKSADDLAKGLYYVVSAGFQGADAMKILEMSAKAATAGLTDTQTVADAVTSALNAYKLTGKDAANVTDLITEAVLQGKTEYGALAGSIGRVLPVAAQLGVGLDEVLASMSTMTRVGLNADEAATALRGTLTALIKPSSGARKELEDLGLSAAGLRDELKSKGLMAVLQELMEKTGGNVEELGKIVPNVRALTGVLATAGSQSESYAKILGSMKDAAGLTDDAFKKTAEGSAVQFDLLKNQLSAVAIELGEKLMPYVISFVSWARELVVQIEAWVKQNPELAKFALIAVGVGVGLSAISVVAGPLIGIIAGLAAVLSGPLILAVLGVGAGVVALKKVWDENLGGIQEKTKGVTDLIGGFLGGVKKGFEDQTTKTLPDYSDAYDNLTHHVNPFRDSIQRVTDGLPPLANEMDKSNKMAHDAARAAQHATEEMDKWNERGRKLGEALAWLWEKVLQPLGAWLVDAFINQIENVIDAVTHLIDAIGHAIEIGQKIGSAIGGAVQGVQSTVGGFFGGSNAAPAAAAPAIFARSWTNGIPMFDTGGVMPAPTEARLISPPPGPRDASDPWAERIARALFGAQPISGAA